MKYSSISKCLLILAFVCFWTQAWAQTEADSDKTPAPAEEKAQAKTEEQQAVAEPPLVVPEPTEKAEPAPEDKKDEKAEEKTEEAPQAEKPETPTEETPAVAETPTEKAPVVEETPAEKPSEEDAAGLDELESLDEIESLEDLGKLEALEELDKAEAIEREQLKFFELNGYLRFRADLFHNLDLGIYNSLRPLGDRGTAVHADNDNRKESTIGTANMRLRLSPTFNISEDIRIFMTVDALDNLVMGSTPDTYLMDSGTNGIPDGTLSTGIGAFSNTQVAPTYGGNSQKDSISVKRAWGEVRTPFGLIKFGRMPMHWGMGMYYNDGNCIDCDYGDTVDRIEFGTKIFEHNLFLGTDFINEGLTNESYSQFTGQPKDATQLDDVHQWTFGFARKHNNAEIEELLENDDFSINYGMHNSLRWQKYAIENSILQDSYAGDFSGRQALRSELLKRDMFVYVGDVWFRFLYKKLHIELEGMWVTGDISNAAQDKSEQEDLEGAGVTDFGVSIDQFGLLFQIDYKFLDDSLFIGAEWGMASGDAYNDNTGNGYDTGFGIYPYNDKQFSFTPYQRTKYGPIKEDHAINNFMFDPDYHVDMILFREIL